MLGSKVATFQYNSAHGEDNFLILDLGNNAFLDAVMDGVTGHGVEEASQSLVDALAAASIKSPDDVVGVLEEVNAEFYQVGGGRFLLTTVSVALFLEDRLYVISAGDSPVFTVGSDSFQQLAGRVGGFLHAGVARAVGSADTLSNLNRAEIVPAAGDRLVLASDGVTDNLMVGELVDMIRAASTPDEAAAQVNGAVASRIEEGALPAQLGRRFRHDDRTGIFRFFNM